MKDTKDKLLSEIIQLKEFNSSNYGGYSNLIKMTISELKEVRRQLKSK